MYNYMILLRRRLFPKKRPDSGDERQSEFSVPEAVENEVDDAVVETGEVEEEVVLLEVAYVEEKDHVRDDDEKERHAGLDHLSVLENAACTVVRHQFPDLEADGDVEEDAEEHSGDPEDEHKGPHFGDEALGKVAFRGDDVVRFGGALLEEVADGSGEQDEQEGS
uniref:Uncharacterized protein n=1 Tax=Steinernema glaseri TaxID=37863 RepID=A0A1I7Y1G8_9BILA